MQLFEAERGRQAFVKTRQVLTPRADTIYVCPLSHVERMVVATGARHLVTLANSSVTVETPLRVRRDRHLRLIMNDIAEPQPGLTSPQAHHIRDLIDFVDSWDRKAPLLMHCLAGISRSTAGCYIALCVLNPHVAESDIALRLRASSATAMPNRLLVGLADAQLGRGGRMLAALDIMGPCLLQCEGVPFSMPAALNA